MSSSPPPNDVRRDSTWAKLSATARSPRPDTSLLTQPSRATKLAIDRAGLPLAAVDLFEFNEAFAAVSLASTDDLEALR